MDLHTDNILGENRFEVVQGDSRRLIFDLPESFVSLSIWSPPYHVGKEYEIGQSFEEWCDLLKTVIAGHQSALKPGGFCVINIADILCFPDETMPRIQAETLSERRLSVTREDILRASNTLNTKDKRRIASYLGVSEQTVDRRLNGNNIRGGKYGTQTRVKCIAGLIEEAALSAGLYMYDRRVWVKDPAWANSRWHSSSLRAVDEFEYLFVLWKPGVSRVDRRRLTPKEWGEWGSRAVWEIPSVRSNDDHEAKFPIELPRRIVRLFSDPGDVVLDPFSGSGTTLVAAIQEGRRAVGFELLGKYVDLSVRNSQDAVRAFEGQSHTDRPSEQRSDI